jgi:HPt (histidine-containing phosphotransfer) domain-containing protein
MPDYLEELCRGECALVGELLHMFLVDAGALMEVLTEQTRLADVTAIARTLHTLKGSCSQMGGQVVSQILEKMEEQLRQGSLETSRELLPGLRVAFESLRAGIEDWLLRVTDDPICR